jgi:hypothetical protein
VNIPSGQHGDGIVGVGGFQVTFGSVPLCESTVSWWEFLGKSVRGERECVALMFAVCRRRLDACLQPSGVPSNQQ